MTRKNHEKRQQQESYFNQNDVYGIFKQEVDSDVNEDANRERLLDESLEAFLDSTQPNRKGTKTRSINQSI